MPIQNCVGNGFAVRVYTLRFKATDAMPLVVRMDDKDGAEVYVSHLEPIDDLCGTNIELVACGEYHSCVVTLSGDLYTWGDGIHNSSLLGYGSEASHWILLKKK
ncbi:hypothetical protein AAG906_034430 [Vitis piasezkii]